MKTLKFIFIFAIAITFTSCNGQQKQKKSEVKATQEQTQEVITLISPTDLEKTDASVQLVDVRTPDEYSQGHIKNAKNINFFDGDFVDQMSKLNKDEAVYIYCRSGGRSGRAAKKLKAAGFKRVYDLKGGFLNWTANGKEVTK